MIPHPAIITINTKSISNDHYLVSFVVSNSADHIIECGHISWDINKIDRKLNERSLAIIKETLSKLPYTEECSCDKVESPTQLYDSFWRVWTKYKKQYFHSLTCLSDRPCPYLSNLFERTIRLDLANRKRFGPNHIINLRPLLECTGVPYANLSKGGEIDKIKLWTEKFWKARKNIENNSIPKVLGEPFITTVFSFDVEKWGVYGKTFWIAYVILIENKEIEKGHLTCQPEDLLDDSVSSKDKQWVENNVLPNFPKEITHQNLKSMLRAFGTIWRRSMRKSQQFVLLGKGMNPIEMETLRDSFKYSRNRYRKDLYDYSSLIVDIQSRMQLLRMCQHEYPRKDSEQAHNPEGDARYTARLYYESERILREKRES